MHTDFGTVRKDAASIVIGTVHVTPTGDITVDVDKVLRGPAVSGTIKVKPSPDGHLNFSDERVIAFLTSANVLRWVGHKVAGPNIENGVVALNGFFDFNANTVSPGLMTVAQMSTLLTTGRLRPVGGSSSSYEQKGGVTLATQGFEFGDAQVILGTSSNVGGTNLALLSAIDGGVFTSCQLLRKGLAPATCTAKQGAPIWVK